MSLALPALPVARFDLAMLKREVLYLLILCGKMMTSVDDAEYVMLNLSDDGIIRRVTITNLLPRTVSSVIFCSCSTGFTIMPIGSYHQGLMRLMVMSLMNSANMIFIIRHFQSETCCELLMCKNWRRHCYVTRDPPFGIWKGKGWGWRH